MDPLSHLPIEDRIRHLPMELLTNILSRLDTKSVMKTSILSKRWRYICQFAPSFEVTFHGPQRSLWRFMEFVKSFFETRDRQTLLDRVDLDVGRLISKKRLRRLLEFVGKHGAKRINVLVNRSICELPMNIIESEHVVKLVVNHVSTGCTKIFKGWKMPKLRHLELSRVWFTHKNLDDGFLFAGCVNLEKLILKECGGKGIEKIKIKFRLLGYLEISNWVSSYGNQTLELMICTPNLSKFEMRGHCVLISFMEYMPDFTEAIFSLPPLLTINFSKKVPDDWYELLAKNGLLQFKNITDLTVSIDTLKALGFSSSRTAKRVKLNFRDQPEIILKSEDIESLSGTIDGITEMEGGAISVFEDTFHFIKGTILNLEVLRVEKDWRGLDGQRQ